MLWRSECEQDALIAGAPGWLDGMEVTVIEEGEGECEGWYRVTGVDDVPSWVREEYVSSEQP